MDQIAECRVPSKLSPNGLGSFPGGVVFVAMKAQLDLLELQKCVVEICRKHNGMIWDYYTPERWIPHCTLMQNLAAHQINPALQAVSSANECPWEIQSMGLIAFPPTQLLEERTELKHHKPSGEDETSILVPRRSIGSPQPSSGSPG